METSFIDRCVVDVLDFNAGVFSESFLKLLSGYMIDRP